MNTSSMAISARQAIHRQTQQIIAAQREFEQTIAHLTPQRQTELMALRQIGIESARKRKFR